MSKHIHIHLERKTKDAEEQLSFQVFNKKTFKYYGCVIATNKTQATKEANLKWPNEILELFKYKGNCNKTKDTREVIGHAPIIQRQTPTWPSRKASYFDLTQWGGGYLRAGTGPGAAVIKGDLLVDIQSGEVYRDSRFAEK